VLLFGLTLGVIAPACAADPFPVAVLNTERIFRTHKPLLAQLEPIKAANAEFEKTVQLRQIELETVAGQLRRAPPGSPEFVRLQQQAVKLQGDLQQFIATERGALQKREAGILLGFYRTMDEEVRKYAQTHGIKLVLRQQESSLDENQPLPEILKSLNRPIVFDDQLDITDAILAALAGREQEKPPAR
jgi:Skp family chaperone for outer membrane proteins